MGLRGPEKGKMNRQGIAKLVRNIVEEGKFYGYEVDQNASPADVILDELIRTNAAVQFIQSQMQDNWNPELVELRQEVYGEQGVSVVDTEEARWLEVYGRERDRLVKVAKVAHDMGIDERRIELAERQAQMMFTVINGLVDAMGLTAEQKQLVPKLLPTLIRQASLPSVAETKGWSEDWSQPGAGEVKDPHYIHGQ